MRLALATALVPFLAAWNPAPITAQEAPSVFDAATVELVPGVAPFRRLADIDHDGDLDAIGAGLATDRSFYRIYAYRNDGRGVFAQSWADAESTGSLPGDLLIEVGNLDGNTWTDVRIVVKGERHDWLGRAGGTFDELGRVSLGSSARAFALVDLDRDGRDDFAWIDDTELHVETGSGDADIAIGGGLKHGLEVLPRDGPGGADVMLAAVGEDVRLFYGGPAIGLVAVDGDGMLDALIGTHDGERTDISEVHRKRGPGWVTFNAFEMAQQLVPAGVLVDLDQDGDLHDLGSRVVFNRTLP